MGGFDPVEGGGGTRNLNSCEETCGGLQVGEKMKITKKKWLMKKKKEKNWVVERVTERKARAGGKQRLKKRKRAGGVFWPGKGFPRDRTKRAGGGGGRVENKRGEDKKPGERGQRDCQNCKKVRGAVTNGRRKNPSAVSGEKKSPEKKPGVEKEKKKPPGELWGKGSLCVPQKRPDTVGKSLTQEKMEGGCQNGPTKKGGRLTATIPRSKVLGKKWSKDRWFKKTEKRGGEWGGGGNNMWSFCTGHVFGGENLRDTCGSQGSRGGNMPGPPGGGTVKPWQKNWFKRGKKKKWTSKKKEDLERGEVLGQFVET